jgi:predicted RND superfamily exporter protein
MRYWGRLVTVYPKPCAVIVLLLTIGLGAGLPRIGFDVQPGATIASDNQASRDLEQLVTQFGPDDNDLVVMVEGDDLLTWENLQELRRLRDQIRAIAEVQLVTSIFDLRRRGTAVAPLVPKVAGDDFDGGRLQDELSRHPVAAGQMISDDGKVLVLWVRIAGGSLPVSTLTEVVGPTLEYARRFEQSTGAEVHVAGHPAVRADVLMLLRKAMFVSCSAAAVMSFLASLALFRALVPVLVVVSAPTVGAVWTFGLLAWCGVPVGGLLTALPNLIFVIGLTDAVHLLLDGQRHLRAGRTRPHAVYGMLMRIGPACLLTSLTTMIGFGSLTISRAESVQVFGFWAALGTTLVVLADVLVLPIIMHWVPAKYLIRGNSERQSFAILIDRLIAPTLRFPAVTTALAIILCLALLPPALSQHPDIIWTEAIPQDAASTVAMGRADEKLGGALLAYVVIRWPDQLDFPNTRITAAAAKTQAVLRETPQFNGSFSILNVLAAAPGRSVDERYRAFRRAAEAIRGRLINPAENVLVVTARVPNDGASALNQRVQDLDLRLASLRNEFPEFEFTVTGSVVAASRNMNAIIIDLARSLALAAGLVFLVFAVAFRSLKFGLLSVIPNAFPLLVAAAGLTLLGYPLQITTAMTFSLCLGLAVDDTMHVLIRYRAVRRHGSDPLTSIHRTIRHVGPALIVTTIILLVGFGTMMTSPLPGVQIYAGLSALTLLTALIGDLLILPALLVFASRD